MHRANPVALERFCTHFQYEPMVFATANGAGQPGYHTNVMLCIGTGFAMGGVHMVSDATRRREVQARLWETGRTVIDLSPEQIGDFAANALELQGTAGPVLALSARAAASLTLAQRKAMEQHATPRPLAVPTIERAGGSVRCMLAGIHLAPRLSTQGHTVARCRASSHIGT